MQWSMGWFMGPIVLLVIRDQYRKVKERKCKMAQASALANEEDVVLARLDDLPAWVCNFLIVTRFCNNYVYLLVACKSYKLVVDS